MTRRRVLTTALAAMIGLAIAPPAQAQAAGFFDDLARAFFSRPATPAMTGDPFEMTVKPKRSRPRPASARPAEPAARLDPATDAFWYLRDPTLKKGDIIIARSGIVVYRGRGGAEHMPSDFTALGETEGLSKAQQQALQAAAASGRSYFASNPPSAMPVAAAQDSKAKSAAAQPQ
jgi:hypothetical protein